MSGRYIYCVRCGQLWNVSAYSDVDENEYICPDCNKKYQRELGDQLAQRLLECRLKRGMSGQTVAELCGMSKSSIYDFEHAKRMPNARQLAAMADFYRVSVDWLMGRG